MATSLTNSVLTTAPVTVFRDRLSSFARWQLPWSQWGSAREPLSLGCNANRFWLLLLNGNTRDFNSWNPTDWCLRCLQSLCRTVWSTLHPLGTAVIFPTGIWSAILWLASPAEYNFVSFQMQKHFVRLQMAARHGHFPSAQSPKYANWLIWNKCLEGSPHAVRSQWGLFVWWLQRWAAADLNWAFFSKCLHCDWPCSLWDWLWFVYISLWWAKTNPP